jgi:hypothetical protein
LRPSYKTLPVFKDTNIVSVELIGRLLSSMKNGRAAGLDQLTSEHLKHCHPIVAVTLCKLLIVSLRLNIFPIALVQVTYCPNTKMRWSQKVSSG